MADEVDRKAKGKVVGTVDNQTQVLMVLNNRKDEGNKEEIYFYVDEEELILYFTEEFTDYVILSAEELEDGKFNIKSHLSEDGTTTDLTRVWKTPKERVNK
jgi:hypothetical protein